MPRGTNLPAVGGFNQSVILDLIRRTPDGLSRVEIAEETGLSAQTISNVTRRLLEDELILEAGKHIQGPGKPRQILQLDAQSRFAIGVHLDPTVVTYVVLDLRGRIVAHERARTPSAGAPDEVVATMAASIDAIIRSSGVDRDRLLGIGIASPGPIDSALGIVLDPPLLEGWKDVPLRDAIAEATGLPVLLEKDVTAAVVAELWTGRDEHASDFAFFYLGTGIGVGLAIGGEVLRGSTGNAGEGGTLFVSAEDMPRARRSDMLGHVASPQFLVQQAVDEGVLASHPESRDLAAYDDAFSELVRLADSGNAGAAAILDRSARFIARSLVSIVNLLDVDEVVFGGPAWARVSKRFTRIIGPILNGHPDRRSRHPIRLDDSSVGEDVAAVGAACLVLDTTLSPRPSALLISR